MNIEGVVRTLPLFEPPIDPALLVRATAAGLDLNLVLNDINAAAPPYRYSVLYGKALELANAVASLGSMALSVLEKADAEELANLRQQHEVATQQAILEVRLAQFREAEESLKAVERSLAVAQERERYYSSREEVNAGEAAALALRVIGQATTFAAQALHSASGAAAYVPDFVIGVAGVSSPLQVTKFGGSNVNAAMAASAKAVEATGVALSMSGDIAGTMAGYRRRKDDWNHQARLATMEIRQIERQIEAATIRVEVARHEVAVVRQQIAQAKEVERFLVRKFSNAQLYAWMRSQLAAVHYQAYKLAFEMARRAEKAFQHERGDPNQTFVNFGYWESTKKGLLAGERLLHDLRRMDAAYIAQNQRELELVKLVSLAEHDPEQLVQLRKSGKAALSLSEVDYDRDFPTHYLRRLKTAAVTVPCTAGPYQGVHGTLRLLEGATRRTRDAVELDTSFGAVQSICTSQAQSDAGVFELQFKDERLLPFEGVGAQSAGGAGSQWEFELSSGNRFSFDSIDDLILEIRYTAREGRDLAVAPVETTRTLRRLVRVRDEFRDAWQAFKDDAASSIDFSLPDASWTRGRDESPSPDTPTVTAVTVYGWWSASAPSGDLNIDIPSPSSSATLGRVSGETKPDTWSDAISHAVGTGAEVWSLAPGNKATLDDLWIVFTYEVTAVAP